MRKAHDLRPAIYQHGTGFRGSIETEVLGTNGAPREYWCCPHWHRSWIAAGRCAIERHRELYAEMDRCSR